MEQQYFSKRDPRLFPKDPRRLYSSCAWPTEKHWHFNREKSYDHVKDTNDSNQNGSRFNSHTFNHQNIESSSRGYENNSKPFFKNFYSQPIRTHGRQFINRDINCHKKNSFHERNTFSHHSQAIHNKSPCSRNRFKDVITYHDNSSNYNTASKRLFQNNDKNWSYNKKERVTLLPDPREKKTLLPEPREKNVLLPEPKEKKMLYPESREKKTLLPDPIVKPKPLLPNPVMTAQRDPRHNSSHPRPHHQETRSSRYRPSRQFSTTSPAKLNSQWMLRKRAEAVKRNNLFSKDNRTINKYSDSKSKNSLVLVKGKSNSEASEDNKTKVNDNSTQNSEIQLSHANTTVKCQSEKSVENLIKKLYNTDVGNNAQINFHTSSREQADVQLPDGSKGIVTKDVERDVTIANKTTSHSKPSNCLVQANITTHTTLSLESKNKKKPVLLLDQNKTVKKQVCINQKGMKTACIKNVNMTKQLNACSKNQMSKAQTAYQSLRLTRLSKNRIKTMSSKYSELKKKRLVDKKSLNNKIKLNNFKRQTRSKSTEESLNKIEKSSKQNSVVLNNIKLRKLKHRNFIDNSSDAMKFKDKHNIVPSENSKITSIKSTKQVLKSNSSTSEAAESLAEIENFIQQLQNVSKSTEQETQSITVQSKLILNEEKSPKENDNKSLSLNVENGLVKTVDKTQPLSKDKLLLNSRVEKMQRLNKLKSLKQNSDLMQPLNKKKSSKQNSGQMQPLNKEKNLKEISDQIEPVNEEKSSKNVKSQPLNEKKSLKNSKLKSVSKKRCLRNVKSQSLNVKECLKKNPSKLQSHLTVSETKCLTKRIDQSQLKKTTFITRTKRTALMQSYIQKAKKSFQSGRSTKFSSITVKNKLKKRRKYFRGGRYNLFLYKKKPKKKPKSSDLEINGSSAETVKSNLARKTLPNTEEKEHTRSNHKIPFIFKSSDSSLQLHNSMRFPMVDKVIKNSPFLPRTSRKTMPKPIVHDDDINCSTKSVISKIHHIVPNVAKKTATYNSIRTFQSECTNKSVNSVNKIFSASCTTFQSTVEKNGISNSTFVINKQTSLRSSSVNHCEETVKWKFLCACMQRPKRLISSLPLEKRMCQAIDNIDGKRIGCSNALFENTLARSSYTLNFIEMCETHVLRLRRHQCCPLCGIFCSQGSFLQCKTTSQGCSSLHFFHHKCLRSMSCPHCGKTTGITEVILKLNQPHPNYASSNLTNSIKRDNALEQKEPILNKIAISHISFNDNLHINNDHPHSVPPKPVPEGCNRYIKFYHSSLRQGESGKVIHYLQIGMQPDFKFETDDNNTPMHVAACHGHLHIVKLLYQAGATIDSVNNDLQTPLMLAIKKKHTDIIKYLLELKASVVTKDYESLTPLHMAARTGLKHICEMICASSREISIDVQDEGGWTPLVWACENEHIEIVCWFLEKGANPRIRDNEGNIALHWAAFAGNKQIAEILLDNDCYVNAVNFLKETPLHISARQDKHDCSVLFLRNGANLQLRNLSGFTPLECCRKNSETKKRLEWYCSNKLVADVFGFQKDTTVFPDISRGKEFCAIPVINEVDNAKFEMNFKYVTDIIPSKSVIIDRTVKRMKACTCIGKCQQSQCYCNSFNLLSHYSENGKLSLNFSYKETPAIFECNKLCHCLATCPNRVVQNGIKHSFQVFRTKYKGWGLRAVSAIPKGTFVCQYTGRLGLASESKESHESFIFELDDKKKYCINAETIGNMSRFINHSCSPNLIPIKVFTDHQDLRFPNIAFFTCIDVAPKEELTFDYGLKFWIGKCQTLLCSCNSENCQYSVMTIDETLQRTLGKRHSEFRLGSLI